VLKNNFELGRGKVTEDWKELHYGALHNQYCSPKNVEMVKHKEHIRWDL
jgi:hypothetical protein